MHLDPELNLHYQNLNRVGCLHLCSDLVLVLANSISSRRLQRIIPLGMPAGHLSGPHVRPCSCTCGKLQGYLARFLFATLIDDLRV